MTGYSGAQGMGTGAMPPKYRLASSLTMKDTGQQSGDELYYSPNGERGP